MSRTDTESRPRRSSVFARYGPIVAIFAVLALMAGLEVANRNRVIGSSAAPVATGGSSASGLPPTFDEARDQGLLQDWGDRCDPDTGRVRMPTVYAPPCVPVFTGDNGGSTYQGVSGDTIRVVNYIASTQGDLGALLQGIIDPPALVRQSERDYLAMLSALHETYGRRIELVNFEASGGPDDAVAARADAIKVAEEIKPFASLNGPMLTTAYANELASRGIICIECGMSVPDSTYQQNAPYMWGSAATPEEFLVNVSDFVVNRLVGRPAEFAGDPTMTTHTRVFGTVHLEQDPPVFSEVERITSEKGADRGWVSKLIETYTLDLAKAPERAATIVAHLKDAGVTTVVFLGDPLMPIYLTQQATRQGYFPEWVVTGTAFTDTTVFGRRYDQQQWRHAFGVSPLPVRMPRDESDAWVLHQWWYGRPPAAETSAPLVYTALSFLLRGIHLAGPDLTPATFRDGLFRWPPTGGGATTPYISYGDHGFYTFGDGSPRPDYLGVDDMAEIWWDGDASGPDETGAGGKGMWRSVDGGKRHLPGAFTPGETQMFEMDGSVTTFDRASRPERDRAPDYPPPPGSPAAAQGP